MANILNRDIESGEVVVVRADLFNPGSEVVEKRAFVVNGGYGRLKDASGEKIFGHWWDGSGDDCIGGFDIDAAETEAWQKTHAAEGEAA